MGWDITFKNNVHMYCHRLKSTKGSTSYEVPCEDTPEGYIGIWFMHTDIDKSVREDLVPVLAEFFHGLGSPFKIYNPDGVVAAELEASK